VVRFRVKTLISFNALIVLRLVIYSDKEVGFLKESLWALMLNLM